MDETGESPSWVNQMDKETIIQKLKELFKKSTSSSTNMYRTSLSIKEINYIAKNKYNLIDSCPFIQDIYDGYGGTGYVIWWNNNK